jgi:hypothetical protein
VSTVDPRQTLLGRSASRGQGSCPERQTAPLASVASRNDATSWARSRLEVQNGSIDMVIFWKEADR